MSETKGISRRQFLTGAAVTVAATAVPVFSNVTPAFAAAPMPVLVPGDPAWVALNPEALARQGYEIYKGLHAGQSACCEGTFWPVIGALGALYPATWGTFPKGVFNFGGGGINGWRAQCGSTNAGAAVLKLTINNGTAMDEFLRWYEKTSLPTAACRASYDLGTWTTAGLPVPFVTTPANAAGSTLCHASLTAWRVAGGNFEALNTGAQSDRCGKIVFDSVFKLATMVNSFMAGGTFVGTLDPEVATCGEGTGSACHGKTGSVYGNPYAQAKMKCSPCHE